MYQFAYSEICDELPSQSISKLHTLSDAMELIEAAQGVAPSSHEWFGVLSDFRRLWLMIVEELPACGHSAGASTHPGIVYLAYGVLQEIERCRFRKNDAAVFARRGMWPQ